MDRTYKLDVAYADATYSVTTKMPKFALRFLHSLLAQDAAIIHNTLVVKSVDQMGVSMVTSREFDAIVARLETA